MGSACGGHSRVSEEGGLGEVAAAACNAAAGSVSEATASEPWTSHARSTTLDHRAGLESAGGERLNGHALGGAGATRP